MAKIITIDNSRYVLPEGMTTKDVQSLAGLLITLVKVEHCYEYPSYENLYYMGEGVQVGIGELALMSKTEARTRSDESRAKVDAAKAAADTAKA